MNLESLTQPTLVLLAEEFGIKVQKSMRKPKIIEAISTCGAEDDEVEKRQQSVSIGVPGIRMILSDSKTAVRNYARSTVWREAEQIVGLAKASRTSER
ncbi:hypothetical protein MRX96_011983 [Rhipicephalus microplus]